MKRRHNSLYWLALLVSAIVLGWSWLQMKNARLAAQQSLEQLQSCLPLSNQLSQLRAEQATFDLVLPADHQPGKVIANAFQQASIALKDPTISVRPGKVLKEGMLETRHLEMPKLEKVELHQLIQFLDFLQNSGVQYHIEGVVLTPAPENRIAGTPKSLWNAQCGLYYFVEAVEQSQNLP